MDQPPRSRKHEANGKKKNRIAWESNGQRCWEAFQPPENFTRPVGSEYYSSQKVQRNNVLSFLMLKKQTKWFCTVTEIPVINFMTDSY